MFIHGRWIIVEPREIPERYMQMRMKWNCLDLMENYICTYKLLWPRAFLSHIADGWGSNVLFCLVGAEGWNTNSGGFPPDYRKNQKIKRSIHTVELSWSGMFKRHQPPLQKLCWRPGRPFPFRMTTRRLISALLTPVPNWRGHIWREACSTAWLVLRYSAFPAINLFARSLSLFGQCSPVYRTRFTYPQSHRNLDVRLNLIFSMLSTTLILSKSLATKFRLSRRRRRRLLSLVCERCLGRRLSIPWTSAMRPTSEL